MTVTLFVDASFFHETRSGAWAFYAISQVDRLTYAGRFQQPIKDSSHAELAAIASALHVILPHRVCAGARKILVQTDCVAAISWIDQARCDHHPLVVAQIYADLAKYGVELETRHIKAHVGVEEPRTYCHDWCDREARRIARRMHAERGGQPTKGRSRQGLRKKR